MDFFSNKLVVVISQDWQSSRAKLFCLQKKANLWNVVMSWNVLIGRNGLGWGRGIELPVKRQGPEKKEGDGKAPAGLFALRRILYGYNPVAPSNIVWPYKQMTSCHIGVDDPASSYYNQILDKTTIPQPDWNSYEEMKRNDILYQWLLVVEHNTQDIRSGAGSCIFFHLTKNSFSPTAGCTAMKEKELLSMVEWLGEEPKPLLLQLPFPVYNSLRKQLTRENLPLLEEN